MKYFTYLSCLTLLTFATAQAQTPGQIFKPATPAANPMDLNGDGWVTQSGAPFSSNDADESEVPYSPVPEDGEPNNDLNTGGGCGVTDIVSDPARAHSAIYAFFGNPDASLGTGDEYLIFRLRIAKDPGNGNFGFSVLLDTDGKIGNADPNVIAGNAGFELEIRVVNGGGSKGLYVDNVDGTTTGTNLASYALGTNTQRSYALATDPDCSNDPVFYDFFVPLSDMGLTASSVARIAAGTSTNGSSVLGGKASEVGGIDDNSINLGNTTAEQDSLYRTLINLQSETSTIADFPNDPSQGLPIKIISFRAFATTQANTINGLLTNILGGELVSIEKKIDNAPYQTIFTELLTGGRGQLQLNFTDAETTANQQVYYRLKLVEANGVSYSNVISVSRMATAGSFKTYPNPFTDVVTWQFEQQGTKRIFTYDAMGRLVYETLSEASTETVNLGELPAGMYVVKLIDQQGQWHQQMVVKR